jgi:hypothetical protein
MLSHLPHQMTVCIGGSRVHGACVMPYRGRLSDWLAGQERLIELIDCVVERPSVAAPLTAARLFVRHESIDIIVDGEQNTVSDPRLWSPREQILLRASYTSGFSLTGILHLPEGAIWQRAAANPEKLLRPVTRATIYHNDTVLYEDVSAFANIYRAAALGEVTDAIIPPAPSVVVSHESDATPRFDASSLG